MFAVDENIALVQESAVPGNTENINGKINEPRPGY
jgi:hypothetical protein